MTQASLFRAHTISGRQPGPQLLITAGVHGDEFEPMAAVERLTRRISSSELTGTITLIPVVNQGAFARAARSGEDGLDLARTCPGDPAGSVTQRVAAELAALIRAATHYIDLHTGGLALRLVPLCGYALHRVPSVLATQRDMAAAFGLPYIWGTTPALEGRTLSVARDANVPAIYVEYGGGATFDPEAVNALERGCLRVAGRLGMLATSMDDVPARPIIVEDDRPASGHLQIQNASPCDGLFEAGVRLGDRVARGDAIGTVRSPLTSEQVTVRASNGGIIFMLRLIASVRMGDALAAIVDPGETP